MWWDWPSILPRMGPGLARPYLSHRREWLWAGNLTGAPPGTRTLDQPPPPPKAPPPVQGAYIDRRIGKAVSASARPSPEGSRARLLASSSQSAPTMRCLRCGRTAIPGRQDARPVPPHRRVTAIRPTPPGRGGRASPTLAALAPDELRAEPAVRQPDRRTARPPHSATPGPAGSRTPSGRSARRAVSSWAYG